MATNFDKSLYQAPLGMGSTETEPDIEIEIEDRDSVAQFVLISCTLQS